MIGGIELPEKPADTAGRVTGVFAEVYQIGDQQRSALYQAIRDGIDVYHEKLTLDILVDLLEEQASDKGAAASSAASVISKIQPFVDSSPFGPEQPEAWESMYRDENSSCHVLQLASMSRDMARLVTEFALIDLYRYYRANGDKTRPRVVVLDEIQNLDHSQDSPLGQLLTEGRKFGISLVLATQIMSSLARDERDRLFQASHKLFFKPADTELRAFAQILQDATGEPQDRWIGRLSSLKRGECYSLGPVANTDGSLDMRRCVKIAIQPLESRR